MSMTPAFQAMRRLAKKIGESVHCDRLARTFDRHHPQDRAEALRGLFTTLSNKAQQLNTVESWRAVQQFLQDIAMQMSHTNAEIGQQLERAKRMTSLSAQRRILKELLASPAISNFCANAPSSDNLFNPEMDQQFNTIFEEHAKKRMDDNHTRANQSVYSPEGWLVKGLVSLIWQLGIDVPLVRAHLQPVATRELQEASGSSSNKQFIPMPK